MEVDPTKVIRMREGGHVQRCHCFPHHGSYDVAQHSFHMLLLLDELHPDPPRRLYSAILRHDLMERWTGDIPAVTSQIMPEMKRAKQSAEEWVRHKTGIEHSCSPGDALTEEDELWVEALDSVEFLMWCDDQLAAGMKVVASKRDNVMATLRARWERWPAPVVRFLKAYRWQRTDDDLS